MKFRTLLLASALFLGACASEPAEETGSAASADVPTGEWRDGKSGICVAKDGTAALIRYADSGANCMAQGTVEAADGDFVFIPRGDEQCRIGISFVDGDVSVTGMGDGCDYYCGGDANLDGATFRTVPDTDNPIVDAAGDNLC